MTISQRSCVFILAGGILTILVPWWPPDTWVSTSSGPQVSAAEATPKASSELARVLGNTDEEDLDQRIDPARDGWDTEILAESTGRQLKVLAKLLKAPGDLTPERLSDLVVDTMACDPLRPRALKEVFRDDLFLVRRGQVPVADDVVTYRGRSGLSDALAELFRPLHGGRLFRADFKVIEIDVVGNQIETKVRVQFSGRTADGRLQVDAVWRCGWLREAETTEAPRLQRIQLDDYTEIQVRSPAPLFADCTEAVLGANPSFSRQLMHGMNHWIKRIEKIHRMFLYARYGLAVGDVDGDGLDDIYVCQPGGLPNRLFIQQADGTAVDRSHEAGVGWLDHSSSALLVDLDNDGDQDLAVATPSGLVLMSNDGKGRFLKKASLQTGHPDVQSLSAVDYDHDGDLDLYLCLDFSVDFKSDRQQMLFVYHDANDGGPNALFRNDLPPLPLGEGRDGGRPRNEGAWRFTNVTVQVGLDMDNRRHSLAASWEDYDNDGDQDLYVANDYGQNCLYRNDEDGRGRRFVNVAGSAGVVDFGSGMSACWGDYNRDGRMDLYVGNMFSSAGRRITRQSRFMPNEDPAIRSLYARFAKGNSLFENATGGRFQEVGAEAGVEMARWAWSSIFADINNDGWEDLLVANGYLTTDDTGDL